MITPEACEILNGRLASIGGFDHCLNINASDFLDKSVRDSPTGKVLTMCTILLQHLNKIDPTFPAPDACNSLAEVYSTLCAYGRTPYFAADSESVYFDIVLYLCAQIQTEVLILNSQRPVTQADNSKNDNQVKHTTASVATAMEIEGDEDRPDSVQLRENVQSRGRLAFQLAKINRIMELKADNATDEVDLADMIAASVTRVVTQHQHLFDKPLPRILTDFVPTVDIISPQQREMILRIESLLYEDYLLRRRMLMKRMDVTIQSFLWSSQASSQEEEIRAAVREQQIHLMDQPMRYTVEDAVYAPVSLLYEHTKKITGDQNFYSSNSVVKKVLVGAVPDRGGRANEVRPKKLESMFPRPKRPPNSGKDGSGGKRDKGDRGSKGAGDAVIPSKSKIDDDDRHTEGITSDTAHGSKGINFSSKGGKNNQSKYTHGRKVTVTDDGGDGNLDRNPKFSDSKKHKTNANNHHGVGKKRTLPS